MVYGQTMCLSQWAAVENGGDEGTRERVARTDRVDHLHAWGVDVRFAGGGEDGAIISPRSENEVAEVVQGHKATAKVVQRVGLEIEEAAQQVELLVVNLEDVAMAQGGRDQFAGVVMLAEVDVVDAQSPLRYVREERLDGDTRLLGALSQSAESDGVGT